MKRRLAIALSVLVTTSVFAQTDSQTEKPKTSHRGSSAPVSKQLEDMKDAISAQQQQIQQLQQQISTRDQAIQQLQQQITNMPKPEAAALRQHPVAATRLEPCSIRSPTSSTVSANTVNELQETQKRLAALESPAGDSLQGNHHYAGRLPGGRNGVAAAR